MNKWLNEIKRTHYCGGLREEDIGKEVVLFGWVGNRRDHGGCIFIDLRDREGITQVVFDPSYSSPEAWKRHSVSQNRESLSTLIEAHSLAETFRGEWVIGVRGVVISRGENKNTKIATGEIEVLAVETVVFNKAETPPFEIIGNIDTREDIRLEHRYVDLRRESMQNIFRTRHKINQVTRNYLSDNGCLELETPFLVKYTPGGARNFLTPSRLSPGKFYALAESPQLYKQLFMVSGFDRYFQIVKCFRDEDLRVDRQPEFTQIDIELSFVNQSDIFRLVEGLVFSIFKTAKGMDLKTLYPSGQFPEIPFYESMTKYGNDKPDLRFGLEHVDLTDVIIDHDGGGFTLWKDLAEGIKSLPQNVPNHLRPNILKAMVIPASANFSRAQIEELERGLKEIKGFRGLARAKVAEDGSWTQSPLSKSITDAARTQINNVVGAKRGDIICFQFGKSSVVHTVMSKLRIDVAKKMKLIPEYGHGDNWKFCWVTNPPLFEYDEDTKSWTAAHHAFTRPLDEDIINLRSNPASVNCYRYDIVLNGFEIGGGSIRLHDPDVQQQVFDTLGINESDAKEKFGFLLDALRSGAPPHGGIALGMDRIVMLISGAATLRDVIPFPKTNQGTDLLTSAPVIVDRKQLNELNIKSTYEQIAS